MSGLQAFRAHDHKDNEDDEEEEDHHVEEEEQDNNGDGDGDGLGFRCSVCFLPFSALHPDKAPIALSCHHALCRACARHLVLQRKSAGQGGLVCVVCNEHTGLAPDGLAGTNHVLVGVLDAVHRLELGHPAPNPTGARAGTHALLCPTHHAPLLFFLPRQRRLACGDCVDALPERDDPRVATPVEGLVEQGEERVGEMEEGEDGLRRRRDEVLREAANAEADINAFFDALERQRASFLASIRTAKKAAAQQLTDVRRASHVLRCSLAHISRTLARPDATVDEASRAVSQLEAFLASTSRLRSHAPSSSSIRFRSLLTPTAIASKLRLDIGDLNPQATWHVSRGVAPSLAASMPVPRRAVGTAVVGGSVFVVGGWNRARAAVDAVTRYDVEEDRWSVAAPMPSPRASCGACVVDGRVVVVGGWSVSGGGRVLRTVEALDKASGNWTQLAPLNTPRRGCGVVALPGRLVVVGGHSGWEFLADVEVLDLRTNTWQADHSLPPLLLARAHFGLVASTAATHLFACGGEKHGSEPTRTCEVWAVHGNAGWAKLPPMPSPRSHCAAAFGGGNVIVAGGRNRRALYNSVVCYCVADETWQHLRPMAFARAMCGVELVGRRLVVLGGEGAGSTVHDSAEVYEF